MSFLFTHPQISLALQTDLSSIEQLLNRAYRGEESVKGWTTESHLISGNTRTTIDHLQKVYDTLGSFFLIYKKEETIIASVNLQKHANKMYLGMFAVDPNAQGMGLGKLLLQASDEWAIHSQCSHIYMTVISVRTELIEWYKRHGYADTGERQPFDEDGYSGSHLQKLEFMVLEKQID
jgi:ribosomal protein S18 acetylase RimI-like enzyme